MELEHESDGAVPPFLHHSGEATLKDSTNYGSTNVFFLDADGTLSEGAILLPRSAGENALAEFDDAWFASLESR